MMYRQHFWHGNGIVRAHGHQRHRPRAVGHRRQGRTACPATSSGAARCATTSASTAISAAARWRTSTRRTRPTPQRFAELARQAVEDGFTAFKSMAVPEHDADRGPAAGPVRRGLRGRDARGGRRRHRHHGRLPRPAVAAHGPAVRQGARAVRPLLVRGALLARERRRPGRDPAGGDDAHRHRRAADRPARLPRAAREAGVQHHPARHHALRRPDRGPADRRHGRGLPRGRSPRTIRRDR